MFMQCKYIDKAGDLTHELGMLCNDSDGNVR